MIRKLQRKSVSVAILVAFALFAVQLPLVAQSSPAKPATRAVLLNGGTSGLTKEQAETFFADLSGKLSQFPSFSVFLRGDIAKQLSAVDRVIFDKAGDLKSMQPILSKSGAQRLLFCKVTKKEDVYQFQSVEYDVTTLQKLSEVADNTICSTADELADFISGIAIKVGQKALHTASIPASLQKPKSNLWWYVGSAVTVGVAAGVYFLVAKSKQSSSSPKSLPGPPNFP